MEIGMESHSRQGEERSENMVYIWGKQMIWFACRTGCDQERRRECLKSKTGKYRALNTLQCFLHL